jgi:hypothetical protein
VRRGCDSPLVAIAVTLAGALMAVTWLRQIQGNRIAPTIDNPSPMAGR